MPLLNDLLDFNENPLMPPPSAQLFAEHLPVEWLQHCLSLSSHATVRRRRLPGDMVVWMVVCMAFFRNEPITEIVRRLNLSADGEAGTQLLARSAITQARQRVGAAPVEWLFRQTAHVWGLSAIPKMTGKVCSSSRLMVHSCVHRMNLNCVNTSAPATHPRSGRTLSR